MANYRRLIPLIFLVLVGCNDASGSDSADSSAVPDNASSKPDTSIPSNSEPTNAGNAQSDNHSESQKENPATDHSQAPQDSNPEDPNEQHTGETIDPGEQHTGETIDPDEQHTDETIDPDTQQTEEPKDPQTPHDPNYVYYSDFGAAGNGKTNDIQAIIDAHAYANAHGMPVRADKDATYYISDIPQSAIIQTDTDWTGAAFIIDDSGIGIDQREDNIFVVRSSEPSYSLISSGIPAEGFISFAPVMRHQNHIDIELPHNAVMQIIDTNVKRYIRSGENQNNGSPQMDYILVDKSGNVSNLSPIIWDYQNITDIQVYPVDNRILTIKGGKFTTIANQAESAYNYYERGISVARSNVVIDSIYHDIEGEQSHGAPYNGFLTMHNAANITVKNSTFTAHKTYGDSGSGNSLNMMGSYDFQPTGIINLTFENCTQTNDIMDISRWGIMGSNYCKTITLKDCAFNRFDAHQGVVDVSILNTTLGYKGLEIIGEGLLTIKDSTFHGYSFISLRNDYGSTWRGDVIIESSEWIPLVSIIPLPLIYGSYTGNHNFGYECYMPTTITINDLRVDDSAHQQSFYLFSDITPQNTSADFQYTYPYHITKDVYLNNLRASSGKDWMRSSNPYMFKDVTIHQEN